MANYSRREYTTRHIEYMIPSGDNWAEMQKAVSAALSEYRQVHGLAPDASVSDDAMWVHAVDPEVVIRFQVEQEDNDHG